MKLEPCRCGGEAGISYIRDGRQIMCVKCGACGPPAFNGPNNDTLERAADAWNMFVSTPTPREKRLEEAMFAITLVKPSDKLDGMNALELAQQIARHALGEHHEG